MKKLFYCAFALQVAASAYAIAPQANISTLQQTSTVSDSVKVSNMSVNRVPKAMLSPVALMEKEALAQGIEGMVKIQQKFQNIDVYGGEVIFEIANGKVLSMDGRISNVRLDSVDPKISKVEAKRAANNFLNRKSPYMAKLVVYPTTEKTYLAWHLVQRAFAEKWHFFIDANTGRVIDSYNALANGVGRGHDGVEVNLESSFDADKNIYVLIDAGKYARETYDAKNGGFIFGPFIGGLPGDLVESNDDTFTDAASVDAHHFAGEYLKVLETKFDRKSFDDKGAKIVSTVHFMKKFVNAFWNGEQMVYGDGDNVNASNLAGGFDVIAHEITHAITEHTSNLEYRNDSGALNEAFSDIMATYAEYVAQPDKFDWLIGEDVWTPATEGDALRYMNDPAKDGSSADYYPDRYQGSQDNGGVHSNSGIANLAFYILSEGGSHPRAKTANVVNGVGIEMAIKLFYNTFTKRLTSTATFADARDAMIKEAQAIGTDAVQAVQDTWAAVGVE